LASTEPRLSVVVPVRDRVSQLREFVTALTAQTLPRTSFEILIGDDGSQDASIRELESEDGWIRVFSGPPVNSYAARNRAAAAARAPVLAFSDSDCRPEPEWLEAGLAALQEADLVAGEIRAIVPRQRTIWTLLDIESGGQARSVRAGFVATGNLFVRRSLFERVGSFDASLPSGSDWDFARRCSELGAHVAFAPGAVVLHPTTNRASPYLRMTWFRVRWYGARRQRAGGRPGVGELLRLVPVVGQGWRRHRAGLPIGLDRRRLAEHGIRTSVREHVQTLAVLYLLLPAVEATAALYGWTSERLRKARSSGTRERR
jgi:GT2 family glycosyltransferase